MTATHRQTSLERQALCEWVDYVDGPHPGCSEFAPPDEIRCTSLQQYRIVWEGFDDPESDAWETQDSFCAHHANLILIDNLANHGYDKVAEILPVIQTAGAER